MSRQDQEHACKAYTELKSRFRDVGRLEAIGEVLGRDFLTAMPEGAYKSRLAQIAYLYRRIQQDLVNKDVQRLIEDAQDHEEAYPNLWSRENHANLREMVRVYYDHSLIGEELMEHNARIINEGRRNHKAAMERNDWHIAKRHLTEVLDVEKRIAEKKMRARGAEGLYDALLQDYCPGCSLSQVEKWFGKLEEELRILLPQVVDKQSGRMAPVPVADFYPAESQMWMNEELLGLFGFDFERGGLYQTGHNPVEGGTPDDTRLVIKSVDTDNFLDSMKSALHELGHGIYIQGLPRAKWRYQPVAKDMGAAMHESQAMVIEMMIGRTREFFNFLAPRLEGLFHAMNDPALRADNLYAIKTRVRPGTDRKKADEISYFFHILLRFRIEKDLIESRMNIEDLPKVWAERLHDMLGVFPENDAEAVLQDVHWFVAKFGYFPSYTIGHMIAAQLWEKMQTDIPKIFSRIEEGDFVPLTQWLTKNIHAKGRIYSMSELLNDLTGSAPSPDFLLAHLENRYLGDG